MYVTVRLLFDISSSHYLLIEGPEGGSQSHFPPEILAKSHAVPVGFLLAIPVRVIEIPVNKKAVIYL